MVGENLIPFISHEDLGAYLETTLNGSDLIVLIALDGACEAVRQHLHRRLNLEVDDQIVMDGNSTSALILPERPVHEVQAASVMLDDAAVADESLYLDVERGLLWMTDGGWWSYGKGNIALTYTHGYALTEDAVDGTIERVPANIRLVALRLAAEVWRSKGATTTGAVTGEHIGTYQYTQEVAAATVLATMTLTPDDRLALDGQRDVFAA